MSDVHSLDSPFSRALRSLFYTIGPGTVTLFLKHISEHSKAHHFRLTVCQHNYNSSHVRLSELGGAVERVPKTSQLVFNACQYCSNTSGNGHCEERVVHTHCAIAFRCEAAPECSLLPELRLLTGRCRFSQIVSA